MRVPPLTLLYLAQYKYAKLRPLRFVATGAVLAALAAVAPGAARQRAGADRGGRSGRRVTTGPVRGVQAGTAPRVPGAAGV
ncbi:hypothetical protein FTUN_2275 [Frigoriglobus tundricola]|uniref:Uncharacterized protein n=1 Tax=Frigoriglobus tundricola TaxID=2774151 RepID=A0A6M5YP49_9BACT|nr:hypothetical protein FTUN_2275 [Frigoriglobus tundricola]